MAVPKSLYRLLDANVNRAKEGLRVCEDICRYVYNEAVLTRALKDLRHDLHKALVDVDMNKALQERDIGHDVGRRTSASESSRQNVQSVFYANAQRVKESLRVLEEVLKLIDPKAAESIKVIRYSFYALEQKALKKR